MELKRLDGFHTKFMTLLNGEETENLKLLLEASNQTWREATEHRQAYEKLMELSSEKISAAMRLVHEAAKVKYDTVNINLITDNDIVQGISVYIPSLLKQIEILHDGSIIYEKS